MSHAFDAKALELSRQAITLFFEPMPGAQLQAKIQNLFIDAMKFAAPAVQAEQLFGNTEQVPDGYALVPVGLLDDLRNAAHFEKSSYAASFGSHIDTGRWKHEYEELERVCMEADRIMAAAPDFRGITNSSTNNFRENAETSTKCWCRTCRPITLGDMRFVVCPDCGNKRCPKANDHRNACSGSNEPGQEGSAYPAVPKL